MRSHIIGLASVIGFVGALTFISPSRADDIPPETTAVEISEGTSDAFWSSPLVWVGGAVLANVALGIGVLAARRKK